MRRHRVRAGLVSSLMAAAMLSTSVVHADGTDDARGHFTRGVELFKEADFRAALIEFQRAYDAAPNYKVLYNLGQTSLELQDYAGALKAFRGYLEGGGNQIPAARRAQVEGDLKKAESRVARVEIAVNVEGADIVIDDVTVGRSPLREPVLVSAGRRKIVATKVGLTAVTRVIDVAGGDRPRVSLDLVDNTQPVQSQVTLPVSPTQTETRTTSNPPPEGRTTTGPSTAFYVSLVSTGTLAVGAGVLGALALVAKSNFDSKLAQVGVQTSQVDDARNQTRSFALATDIVGGVAIAGAITTVILALTTSGKHETREHAHLVVSPSFIGLAGEL